MAGNSIFDKGQVTFQADRILSAIDPGSVKLDGRSFYDLVEQSFRFARTINFFNSEDVVDGTWENLFNDITMMTADGPAIDRDKVDRMMCSGETPPPLALLLTFIRLFSIEQDNLNLLTRKHLEFYYHDILRMSKRKGSAGNVPVRLEIDKGYENVFIPKGTIFLAGKDADGKDIRYRSIRDYSLTKARITDTEAFRKGSWHYEPGVLDGVKMPYRGFGFAIASPMFGFGHGEARLQFNETNATLHTLFENLESISYTSEKGWVTVPATRIEDNSGASSGSLGSMVGADLLVDTFMSEVKFTVEESSPIAGYDASVHGGCYETKDPVIFLDFGRSIYTLRDSDKAAGFKLTGVVIPFYDGFTLEGEYGTLQNKPGVMPFGNEPPAGVTFALKTPLLRYITSHIFIDGLNRACCTSSTNGDTMTIMLSENIDYKGYAGKVIEAIKNDTTLPVKPESPVLVRSYCMTDVTLKCDENIYYSVSPHGEASGKPYEALMDFRGLLLNNSEGGYHIGISDAIPDSVISCYFRVSPKGSNCTSEVMIKALQDNRFDKDVEIITDSTKGLTRSGVMSFRLSPTNRDTMMPADRKWIGVTHCPVWINQIDSQVIEVEPDPESPGKVPVGTALPAGTISKVEKKIKGLKSVSQEIDGDKGRADETDVQFYARISELLRHKNMACSAWDYERLILEKFPQVAGVNCRRARNIDKPGTIWINVIPGMEARVNPDTLDDVFPESTLNDIKEFLKEHTSPFANIKVNNPRYQTVRIVAEVSLKKEYAGNEEFYKEKINKAIIEFLTPWKDDDQLYTLTTNRFNISKITYMLENLDYVDHVKEISACHNKQIMDGYVNVAESDSLLTILIPDRFNNITIK